MSTSNAICFLNKHNTRSNLFRLHSHDCYELIYVLAGSGHMILGEEEHPILQHSFCIVGPHVKHTECMDGYGEILFIGFYHDGTRYPLQEGVYHSSVSDHFPLLENIFIEYQEQSAGYETAAQSLLDLFLITSLRRHGNPAAESQSEKSLDHIRRYIEQHADQKINFKELSAGSGYSNDYFRHIFRKKFQVSPQEYLIDTRLNNARHMLLNTEHSCTEIAYLCGFSNAAQLSSMFRKKWGFPPSEYKNAHRK